MPLIPGVIGSKKLVLDEEEAYVEVSGLCNANTRRPYGELQSVDKCNFLCFNGMSSELFRGFIVCPGWGCQQEKVLEIVTELKKRMKDRGDTGQIRRTEDLLVKIDALADELADAKADLRAIVKALNIPSTSSIENMDRGA